MKTVKFYTLGCKVNQYETQSIRERFMLKGFKEVSGARPANVYLINTCTVTRKADTESFWLMRKARRESPEAKIIITGCLVEKDAYYLSRLKGIDAVISKKFFPEGISDFHGHTRAFLKIQDGCNNFCSYCKVPLVRGRSRSRPLKEVIKEANQLVRKGFKELVLTGINLGSYGKDLKKKVALVAVISELEKIRGLLRIRLSSIEAADVTGALIDKIACSKKLCRHLHIPIQSGDNHILQKMKRRYYRNDYAKLVKKLREHMPDIAITTDCLVGFPGESEKNFANTVSLLKAILPLKVHIFPYSERPDTTAGSLAGKVAPSIIKKRIMKLECICRDLALKYKEEFLNKNRRVLLESRSRIDPRFWEGHTDNYIKVRIRSKKYLRNRLMTCILRQENIC